MGGGRNAPWFGATFWSARRISSAKIAEYIAFPRWQSADSGHFCVVSELIEKTARKNNFFRGKHLKNAENNGIILTYTELLCLNIIISIKKRTKFVFSPRSKGRKKKAVSLPAKQGKEKGGFFPPRSGGKKKGGFFPPRSGGKKQAISLPREAGGEKIKQCICF